ncbi:MAG: hypothetical protein E7Z92_00760 [Cyanobacteria bacterium SIG31]|nr:hypothetical protein [Cyanobacteria bacterium SIG31]
MKKILPVFKDERDRAIAVTIIILSMFLFFIPSLLGVLFLKEQLSESAYAVVKAFFNFELMLFLVSLLFVIPIIGWILAFILTPLMMILNVIIAILALCAIAKNTEVKVPVWYEFI